MNCTEFKLNIPDFLTGEISPNGRRDVENHMAACDSCRKELENLTAVWTKLGVLPQEVPGDSLRSQFYTMLEAYKSGLEEKRKVPFRPLRTLMNRLEFFWPRSPGFQFLAALSFLILGLGAGLVLNRGGASAGDLSRLTSEVRNVRQTLAVSLLRQSSPGERLRGVSLSAELERPDPSLLEALTTTLNTDSNVNVRLAAVDALYLFADNPPVKESLVRSLSQQTSPLVQVALVDLLVDIREKRAIDALKQLIENEEIDPEVRDRAETGLEQLSL